MDVSGSSTEKKSAEFPWFALQVRSRREALSRLTWRGRVMSVFFLSTRASVVGRTG